MIVPSVYKGKKVVVAGLGKTGLGAAQSLHAAGAVLFLYDDNEKSLADALTKFSGARGIAANFAQGDVDFVVLSPGIQIWGEAAHPLVQNCREHNVEIISDIDLLYQSAPDATFVGITGTNGKSTTTALIGHILKNAGIKVQVGGNIGISVMELETLGENGVYVLELSSFQLDLIQHLQLDYSVITNITPDHIDRHLTMENYVRAKRKILDLTTDLNNASICIDYPVTSSWRAHGLGVAIQSQPCWVTTNYNVSDDDGIGFSINSRVLYDHKRALSFDLNGMQYLPGRHNEENIACAYAVASKLGVEPNKIVSAVKSFTGLEHRLEKFCETASVEFINDSKATNADSTEKALLSFENIHLILGGKPKEGGIESIADLIKQKCQMVYLIGYAQEEFAHTLDAHGVAYRKMGTLERVADMLHEDRQLRGVVLLSPACASYDQFANFEQRGIEFKRLILDRFETK